MANEGVLGKTRISGEKAATDDHPVIIHALPLDASVTDPLAPGLLMERTASNTYQPYNPSDDQPGDPHGDPPVDPQNINVLCAVVNEPCDPAVETSAKCIVHGCAKTRLLSVGGAPADAAAIAALMDRGIFAV
jgi:hypothetical protein